MDLDALRASPVGRLVRIAGTDQRTLRDYDHYAFVPDPLPERVTLRQETWKSVTEAAASIGQLRQVCAQLPNPQLLILPALAKEAVATSALEGTYGTLPDVLEARLPGFEPKSPEIREIRAYEHMAQHGFEWVQERPITLNMLCELQQVLAESSRHKSRDPGKIRRDQVVIGPEDCTVYDARFVPPPADDHLRSGLDAWQEWVNSEHGLPVPVRAAMAHYQLETLHPFNDCNGRVGRLVILLQLLLDGALDVPSLTVSPWFLRRRTEYQDGLLAVSRTGDWDAWVSFFCRGLKEQCDLHVHVARQLLDWMNDLRRRLLDRHWHGVIVQVAEALIEWPIVTNRLIQLNYDVRAPAAQSAIDRLVELDAVKELTGRNYARVYGATTVMNLVESL